MKGGTWQSDAILSGVHYCKPPSQHVDCYFSVDMVNDYKRRMKKGFTRNLGLLDLVGYKIWKSDFSIAFFWNLIFGLAVDGSNLNVVSYNWIDSAGGSSKFYPWKLIAVVALLVDY